MKEKAEQTLFRNYVADGLKILTGNTANEEKYVLTLRYSELLNGKQPEKEKTAEEIIAEIKAKVEGG